MKTIQSITKALADELDGWEFTESKRGTPSLLRRQDGAGIGFLTYRPRPNGEIGDTDRLVFYVKWPEVTTDDPGATEYQRFCPYNETFEITCAASRTTASIAKDIKRRLLPGYLSKYAEMLEVKKVYLKRAQRTEINVTCIAKVLGRCTIEGHNEIHINGNSWGVFRVQAACADINLRDVPIDTAIAIAKLVKELK